MHVFAKGMPLPSRIFIFDNALLYIKVILSFLNNIIKLMSSRCTLKMEYLPIFYEIKCFRDIT